MHYTTTTTIDFGSCITGLHVWSYSKLGHDPKQVPSTITKDLLHSAYPSCYPQPTMNNQHT